MCEKQSEHSRQPFSVQGWFDISVTGVFIEQHRALLSPPFYTASPFQPRHFWQPCSLTGKAIMSAHWQQIACCANWFVGPLAGAQCSSLCSDTIHLFFDALLHSTRTIYIKMSVFFLLFFNLIQTLAFLPQSDILSFHLQTCDYWPIHGDAILKNIDKVVREVLCLCRKYYVYADFVWALWNSLPNTHCTYPSTFKSQIETHLFRAAFYLLTCFMYMFTVFSCKIM